jgi:hypothetical protein
MLFNGLPWALCGGRGGLACLRETWYIGMVIPKTCWTRSDERGIFLLGREAAIEAAKREDKAGSDGDGWVGCGVESSVVVEIWGRWQLLPARCKGAR